MSYCHNPYFNRWFSAMNIKINGKEVNMSHNPYFNRWFSAIGKADIQKVFIKKSHNPYFNRWFSAIFLRIIEVIKWKVVTILILIDGFLQ